MLQQTVIMPHVTFSCHAQGKINDVLGFIMNNYQNISPVRCPYTVIALSVNTVLQEVGPNLPIIILRKL